MDWLPVLVLDSGIAVARQVRRRLAEVGLLAPPRAGRDFFWTSGHPEKIHKVMVDLWGDGIELRPLCEQESTQKLVRAYLLSEPE